MKKVNCLALIAILLMFCSLPISAQITIKDILTYSDSPLPYPKPKHRYIRYRISYPEGTIPNRIYKNLQCTDYDFAPDKYPFTGSAYAKFQLPQQNATLIAVNFGGFTDSKTDVLASVDSDGNILDTLEVAVGYVYIKQYRILADGQIIVTTIKPKQEASILFEDFNSSDSFVGNRIDCTYIVDNGKFVLKKQQKYADKTYTYELLSDYNYRLWNGDEQLLNE